MCTTLDNVTSLAHTFRDKFNGDLSGAIESKNETQVETLTALTKICNTVSDIQQVSGDGQESPQLDDIYKRLVHIR